MKNIRNYGVLLPVSALPSGEGIGTLGKEAYNFIDFLHGAGGRVWQVLPLNPTNYGDSPYQSCSADALNYYFIDLEFLVEEGLLERGEVDLAKLCDCARRVNYGKQFSEKISLLAKAFARFDGGKDFCDFLERGEYNDFAVFMALKTHFNHVAWTEWAPEYRKYGSRAVEKFCKENQRKILFWQFTQYIFLKQWQKLKEYANQRGVSLMGDIPLYIAYDSAEVWKYGDKLFKMDGERKMSVVAGCPPDDFTADGQLWGNPVYDWNKMSADGYSWWKSRIRRCFEFFDILRIDHFRGFDRYWEVPAKDKTARGGWWADGPKEKLFESILDYNIVAEDLGVIDDGVRSLMENVGYPGMKIMEFAFDGNPENEHKPSNHTQNFVCYTGTHDNMPLRQCIEDLRGKDKEVYIKDLFKECAVFGVEAKVSSAEDICRTVIELAFKSKANTVIIPLWDLLAFGGEARINLPSTVSENNWSWRFVREDFTEELKDFLIKVGAETERI